MYPIPKSLLIHTVTLLKTTREDRWGNRKEQEEIRLQHVRMEPSGKVVRDKNNAELQLSAILIYDCKNSRPKNVEFEVDAGILFNGQKYKLQDIEALYDKKKLHHYELGVIRDA